MINLAIFWENSFAVKQRYQTYQLLIGQKLMKKARIWIFAPKLTFNTLFWTHNSNELKNWKTDDSRKKYYATFWGIFNHCVEFWCGRNVQKQQKSSISWDYINLRPWQKSTRPSTPIAGYFLARVVTDSSKKYRKDEKGHIWPSNGRLSIRWILRRKTR